MIIYNVTVNVDDSIHYQWLEWLRNVHIPDMLSTGLFTGHRLCRLLDVEDEGTTYSVQYSCKSLTEYNTYKAEHAARLQQETARKFGGQSGDKFVTFRTLLEVVE